MSDPDPTIRTSHRRRRTSTTKPTPTSRHVEFSDLPPPMASPVRPPTSLIDSNSDNEDDLDASSFGGAHASSPSLDWNDGTASVASTAHTEVSVSARSFASVDTERTEKAGNRTATSTSGGGCGGGGSSSRARAVPRRVGVGVGGKGGGGTVSAAQAKKNAELAKRIAGYEEQYHQRRAEKGKKRGRNRNHLTGNGGGGSGGGSGGGGAGGQGLPNSGFQARAAAAAASYQAGGMPSSASGGGSSDGSFPWGAGGQGLPNSGFQARAAAAAASHQAGGMPSSASGGGSSDGSFPSSGGSGSDGAQPEAKVVAEVMAELEAELDAEEDEERAAGVTTELRRSRSGDPTFAGGGGGSAGGGAGRRSRSNSNQHGIHGAAATPTTELRRYKSAGPEAGGGGDRAELSKRSTASSASGVSTAAVVAGSNHPMRTARSRRRSSHLPNHKEGTAAATPTAARRRSSNASGGSGSGDGNGGPNNPNPAAADADPATTRVPDVVADKDSEAAAALFQMGQMEMTNGHFEAAARCLEQALVLHQTTLGRDHPIVGDIQHSLGLVQIEYGKYETACMTLWEAQRIRKLNTDLVGAADSLQEIGKVHRQGGRTELALDCYGECLRVRRAELGDDHLKVADAYCDLGHTEGDLGRNTDALQHFKNALTILKLNSMNDSGLDGRGQLKHGDQICHLLQKMSKMELDFGDVDHALAHLQEFVETRRLIGRTSDVTYVEALVNVGRISKDHNGDEETAYDVLVEALEVFDASRLGEINYGSHARLGQEARDLLRELGGSAGTSQKSIFKRFGVGFDSLSDEIG